MKANVFFKAVCVAVVMVTSTLMVKAGNPYYTNDVTDGDQVTSRFVYRNDNGLHYHLKYDFTYDANNRMASKETYQWNSKNQEWALQSKVQFTYNGSEILVESDATSRKENKSLALHTQQSIYDINHIATAMASSK